MMKLFINGALEKSQSATGVKLSPVGASFTPVLFIGEKPTADRQQSLSGALDDFRVYKRPLSATEIQQLAQ
jgi:Concanavalin A-like lectin/glucanases superfamily